jgi:plasmid maintenance system antidote protein VapI
VARRTVATCRRQINYIGKAANRWEEQFFLGMDEDAAIDYGADPRAALFDELMVAVGKFGKPQLASRIGISRNSLAKILDLKCQNVSPRISQKIGSAIAALNVHSLGEEKQNAILLELARAETAEIGLSEFARLLEIDASNLSKVTDGKWKLSRQLAARFERYLEGRG